MIAEAKYVQFSELIEITTAQGPAVRITGGILHSSLAVKKVEVKMKKDAAIVKVYLTLARPGFRSGNFIVDVHLDKGVRRILFGSSEVQIWPPLQK